MFIKICGITRIEDALAALEAGATALGFVCWTKSPRCIDPARAAAIVAALPPGIDRIGVFVDESAPRIRELVAQIGLTGVQLHGHEPASYAAEIESPVLRALRVDEVEDVAADWPSATLLLDAIDPAMRGGTGERIDWGAAARVARTRRVVLAGGLTPDNVSEAIAAVRPSGVDVSSGVERSPGVKDTDKMIRFVRNARAAFEQVGAD
jgi:phosphoribosylanthranilate isomerase